MKRTRFATALAAAACLGMVLPPRAFAGDSTTSTDIALRPGGVLVGQVVDPQGVAKSRAAVAIRYGNDEVVRTVTDENGVFAARGLRGGQYQIVTDNSANFCRLWAPNTAPPAANDAVLIVTGQNVVRGQVPGPYGYVDESYGDPYGDAYGGGSYAGAWFNWVKSHPYITAGIAAALVATPIAIAASDGDSNS